ncbi:unnamed protein product, partial [Sphacelaria rigidula]
GSRTEPPSRGYAEEEEESGVGEFAVGFSGRSVERPPSPSPSVGEVPTVRQRFLAPSNSTILASGTLNREGESESPVHQDGAGVVRDRVLTSENDGARCGGTCIGGEDHGNRRRKRSAGVSPIMGSRWLSAVAGARRFREREQTAVALAAVGDREEERKAEERGEGGGDGRNSCGDSGVGSHVEEAAGEGVVTAMVNGYCRQYPYGDVTAACGDIGNRGTQEKEEREEKTGAGNVEGSTSPRVTAETSAYEGNDRTAAAAAVSPPAPVTLATTPPLASVRTGWPSSVPHARSQRGTAADLEPQGRQGMLQVAAAASAAAAEVAKQQKSTVQPRPRPEPEPGPPRRHKPGAGL